jgi:hypothetical protein
MRRLARIAYSLQNTVQADVAHASDVGWAVLPASRPTGRLVDEAFVEPISPPESGLAGTTAHPTSLLTAFMESIACKLGFRRACRAEIHLGLSRRTALNRRPKGQRGTLKRAPHPLVWKCQRSGAGCRIALLGALLILELAACKHKGHPSESRSAESRPAESTGGVSAPADVAAPVLSVLKMSDPNAESQLLRGFYGVESGSWRWTTSKFALTLRPPEGSAQQGATLEFKFSLSEVVVNKVGPVTLSAKINGVPLPSQTYSKPGEYTYSAAVPADALRTNTASLEFSTDKVMPPGNGDKRELALVAVSAALLPVGAQAIGAQAK